MGKLGRGHGAGAGERNSKQISRLTKAGKVRQVPGKARWGGKGLEKADNSVVKKTSLLFYTDPAHTPAFFTESEPELQKRTHTCTQVTAGDVPAKSQQAVGLSQPGEASLAPWNSGQTH